MVLAKKNASARVLKKQAQVESFHIVLERIIDLLMRISDDPHSRNAEHSRRLTIVDFASGSGALVLPLAHLFPEHDFVMVDMKAMAIDLGLSRAREAGLTNLRGFVSMIEDFDAVSTYDVALGLHACGNATDWIMEMAIKHDAAYIVNPCCLGKLNFSLQGGSSYHRVYAPTKHVSREATDEASQLHDSVRMSSVETLPQRRISHPRSAWLGAFVGNNKELYAELAAVADMELKDPSDARMSMHCAAKRHVALDRNHRVVEMNARVRQHGYRI